MNSRKEQMLHNEVVCIWGGVGGRKPDIFKEYYVQKKTAQTNSE